MINIWMSYLHVCTYSCFVQWVYIVFLQSCALRIPIIAPVRGQQTNKHKHLTSAIGHHHDHPIMRHLLHILDNRPEPRLLDCKSLMIANVFSRNATIFYSVYSCVSGWTSDAFQLQAVGDIDSHLSQETNALVLSEAWLLQISLAILGLHHWVWHLEYKNSLFEDVLPQVIALFLSRRLCLNTEGFHQVFIIWSAKYGCIWTSCMGHRLQRSGLWHFGTFAGD